MRRVISNSTRTTGAMIAGMTGAMIGATGVMIDAMTEVATEVIGTSRHMAVGTLNFT